MLNRNESCFHLGQSRGLRIIIPAIFLFTQTVFAQTGSISGTVSDISGNALPGANIVVEGQAFGTASDLSGRFFLGDLNVGEHILNVSYMGYKPESKNILVPAGLEIEVDFVLEKSAFSGSSVMVTATRRETNIQNTSGSISAISGAHLEEQGKVDVTQFIDAIPGVTSVSVGVGVNRIIFRNIAVSTQEAGKPTSATYFDDFPISAPWGRGIPDIRLVDMERVEVMKGPQGTLFGRSAMGGIVRYISSKPTTSNFKAGLNTYTSSTVDGGINIGGHAFLNLPVTDKLAIRTLAYTYQNSGFIDNIELDKSDVNNEETWGGRFALLWDITDAFSLGATYLKQDMKGAYSTVTTIRDPGDLDVAGDEGPNIPFDVEARTAIAGTLMERDQIDDYINLKLEYNLNYFKSTLLVTNTKNQFGWVFDEREFLDLHAGTAPDLNGRDDTNLASVVDRNIVELRLVSDNDSYFDWIAGLYHEDYTSQGHLYTEYSGPDQLLFGFFPIIIGEPGKDNESNSSGGENAFYGEVGFNFLKTTRIVVGARHSSLKSSVELTKLGGFFNLLTNAIINEGKTFKTEGDVNTYKLALEQRVSEDMFAYALLSTGYRGGGYNLPTAVAPFSTYDSDRLTNYELGLKSSLLNGLLRTSVAGYLIKYDDIQLVVQQPVYFNRVTNNAGKAQTLGLEFGLDYFINDNLRLNFNGSISKPELLEDVPPSKVFDYDDNYVVVDSHYVYTGRKGDLLPGSATENFSVSLEFKQSISNRVGFFSNASYRYIGSRLNDFNLDLDVELPAYSLTDLRMGLSYGSGLRVTLFVDNLFDEAIIYYIDRQGTTGYEMVPTNRPRTSGVNLSYNF
mgnify:CR=1 FL=1